MANIEQDTIDILHVEDDADFADLCASYLERVHDCFRIRNETNAQDGVTALETDNVDCIVSDYDMPMADGIDFLRMVREASYDLPFILFTGKGSEEIASDAISAGVTDYLQKESQLEQFTILANRIRNAVESYHHEREAEQYYQQLESITEHSHDAIITVDEESKITFANPAVEQHFGYTPEALVGEPLTKLMPERLRDRHLGAIERYLRTGERSVSWANAQFDGLHKDGHEVPLSVSYGEFEHNGGQRFIGIMRVRR